MFMEGCRGQSYGGGSISDVDMHSVYLNAILCYLMPTLLAMYMCFD